MIASVAGRVAHVGLDHVVVEVAGVGLRVVTTPGVASAQRVGASARLATTLVVREDSLTLYGFSDDDERSVFETLQTVSGVGPRLALAALAVLTPEQVRVAIAGEQITTLTKVPGIGRKGAERLVLELRDRIGAPSGTPSAAQQAAPEPQTAPWRAQVEQALVGLGWSEKQAVAGLDRVAGSLGEEPDVSQALRAALKELGR